VLHGKGVEFMSAEEFARRDSAPRLRSQILKIKTEEMLTSLTCLIESTLLLISAPGQLCVRRVKRLKEVPVKRFFVVVVVVVRMNHEG